MKSVYYNEKNREWFVNEKRKLKNKRKGENVIEVFLKVVKANRSFRWYSNGIFMQNIFESNYERVCSKVL